MVDNQRQIEFIYSIFKQFPSIQTDTRKLQKGDIYFALKGTNFNGNQFALQALELGAAYAIVDESISEENNQIIKVDNALLTLQQLAKYHRQQLNIPVIAITGSNGKTTTKELVSVVLSSHFTTYTTQGNLNNHIGVPLTILQIKTNAQIAVVEMGANHQKEIEGYCLYTLPTHGLITNCGKAHLEGFGGVEGVKKGKGELYDFIRANDGCIFINGDYDYLQLMSRGINKRVVYSTHDGDIVGNIIAEDPFLIVSIKDNADLSAINTQLVGGYNLPNVLAAVAIGNYFKIPFSKIKSAIESYVPSNSRSQLIKAGSNNIIVDAYNANPSSMKLAIENFAKIDAPQKIVLIGGMKELGEDSIEEHQAIINLINNYTWYKVVLVGNDFDKVIHSYQYFETSLLAKDWFVKQQFSDAYILIKGSRSIQMEKIIE